MMNAVDIILLAVIGAALVGAILLWRYKKKHGGGCCGDCCQCHMDCGTDKKK